MKLDPAATGVGGFYYEWLRGVSQGVVGAADLGECLTTVGQIRDGNFASWTAAWQARAQAAEAAASTCDESATAGRLLRASNYYRMAAFYARPDEPAHQHLWASGRACFRRAAEQGLADVETVTIPFGEARLPGYFLDAGPGSRPTLVVTGGFDSTAEELYGWIGARAQAAGWHCLIFEGPGQWGGLFDNPGLVMTAAWERPVSAAIDWLVTHPGVDRRRIALIGYSLGGYLAPRAFAFEPRLAACAASPIAVDIGAAFRTAWPRALSAAPPVLFDALFAGMARFSPAARWALQHARWSAGIERAHDFFAFWEPFTLRGLEEQFNRPLLICIGEDDLAGMGKQLVIDTLDFVTQLPGPVSVQLFSRTEGGAAHCQMGALDAAAGCVLRWLDWVTGSTERPSGLDIRGDVIGLLRRHHEGEVAELARLMLAERAPQAAETGAR